MKRALFVLLLCALSLRMALACPFLDQMKAANKPFSAKDAAACPHLHGLRKMSALQELPKAPGGTYDTTGTSFPIPVGGITQSCLIPGYTDKICKGTFTWVDYFDAQVRDYNQGPLCYWSWQTLPPPPPYSNNQYNYTGLRFQEIVTYGELAFNRMINLNSSKACVTSGLNSDNCIFTGSFFTVGADQTKFMCGANVMPDRAYCVPGQYNQSMRFPFASVIVKFDGYNADKIKSEMGTWRSSPAGHQPMITSTLVWNEKWGQTGILSAKIVKCADIPSQFLSASLSREANVAPRPSGRVLSDEALQFWAGYKSIQESAAFLNGTIPPPWKKVVQPSAAVPSASLSLQALVGAFFLLAAAFVW